MPKYAPYKASIARIAVVRNAVVQGIKQGGGGKAYHENMELYVAEPYRLFFLSSSGGS